MCINCNPSQQRPQRPLPLHRPIPRPVPCPCLRPPPYIPWHPQNKKPLPPPYINGYLCRSTLYNDNPCCEGERGIDKIIHVQEINHNTQELVFLADGREKIISKGYIPGHYDIHGNGPKYQRLGCAESGGNLESEGMDCPNYVFNRSKAGASY